MRAIAAAVCLAVAFLITVICVGSVVAVLAASGASAEGCRHVRYYDHWTGRVVSRCVRVRTYYTPEDAPTRVYGYTRRDEDEDRRPGKEDCRAMRRAVGNQHLTVDGAKKAANDAWAGTIRFHLGEKFMDLGNAKRIVYTCSRSSIKEGDVTTLGQTLTRCEIEAIPCRPLREEEGR